jgi:hypothetical protein
VPDQGQEGLWEESQPVCCLLLRSAIQTSPKRRLTAEVEAGVSMAAADLVGFTGAGFMAAGSTAASRACTMVSAMGTPPLEPELGQRTVRLVGGYGS